MARAVGVTSPLSLFVGNGDGQFLFVLGLGSQNCNISIVVFSWLVPTQRQDVEIQPHVAKRLNTTAHRFMILRLAMLIFKKDGRIGIG